MLERRLEVVTILMALALLAAESGPRAPEFEASRDHPLHAIIDIFEAPAAAGARDAVHGPVSRQAWPVRFALPVSRHSEIRDTSRITVQGSDVVEFQVTGRWPDGSVKWLQIDAQVDFDPEKSSRCLLVTSGEPTLAEGAMARSDGEAVLVGTGRNEFRVSDTLETAGRTLAMFSAKTGGESRPAKVESVEITEPGAMRTQVIAEGRHGEALRFRTRYTFFRDRGLVRIDHEVMAPEGTPDAATRCEISAQVAMPKGETTSGQSWVSRGDSEQRVTVVAPTFLADRESASVAIDQVAWPVASVVPGQTLGFQLWLDVEGKTPPRELAHAVLNPLVARAVENAQYSDTATMPKPVLAPMALRFFHVRNKIAFDPTVGAVREPADEVAEAFYDGLRDTEGPAEAFARSLRGLEATLAAAPPEQAKGALLGLALHARLRGDQRAREALKVRSARLGPRDVTSRVPLARLMGPVTTSESFELPALVGRFSVSELTEMIRTVAMVIEDGEETDDDRFHDFAERASDMILRGAWSADGFRPAIESDGTSVTADGEPSPLSTDVGAALIQRYRVTGERAVLERVLSHLRQHASLSGSAAPVRGDSLNHDLVHLMLNLPVIATWRELPLEVTDGQDGVTVLSWTVPEGASRLRIKFADRPIVTPGLDAPTALDDGTLPFAVAVNLDGEPAPATPGTKQSLEVIGDATHFAARYLDVPQRVRREFARGPTRSRVALPGWENAATGATADGVEQGASGLPMRVIRFAALSVIVFVLIVIALRRN